MSLGPFCVPEVFLTEVSLIKLRRVSMTEFGNVEVRRSGNESVRGREPGAGTAETDPLTSP